MDADQTNQDAQDAMAKASAPREGAGVPRSEYPLFTDAERYIRLRERAHGFGFLKRWTERRAIARCLKMAGDLRTLCDAPCGPGRLFPVWAKWAPSIIGVDLSDPMVEASSRRLRDMGVRGEVRKGDVFQLRRAIDEPVDVVACIRLCYYFDHEGRVQLLKALAAASRRYVLVQYKTLQTVKGRRNASVTARGRTAHKAKFFCTDDEIRAETAQAGLACLRFSPIGWTSDRTFVLTEKIRPWVRRAP